MSPSPENDARVAVYIDFDNIVISRYDQVHGRESWRKENARDAKPAVLARLDEARIDVGEILDFASSFGTVALSRAYADWSVPANARYREQLVDRAVDLTQLFQATKAGKNGADIRLSVDVIDDLFRLPDITHVVIVAGDSDYIPLAQRCKRLGRFVIGLGAEGGTSPAFVKACDEFTYYDEILEDEAEEEAQTPAPAPELAAAPAGRMTERAAARLLVKAINSAAERRGDPWVPQSELGNLLRRLDPSFSLGRIDPPYDNLSDFVESRKSQIEWKSDGAERLVRLRPSGRRKP